VEAYLGGQAVGEATRDVLFGAVNPSGRLPESFPKKLENTPAFLTFGGEKDRAVYSEGVFVGYRYYEKKKMEVLFPFGFGLSYTDFAYSNLRLSKVRMKDTDTLYVQADVSNRGSVAGKDVVQLYVADRESTAFRPVRELKGFRKVFLNPGETKQVRFQLDKRAFSCWNAELHDWYAETGDYGIQIGRNSRDIVLEEDVFVESTSKLPAWFTTDSILMDVLADPHGRQVLESLDNLMKQFIGLNTPRDENRSKAEDNAITVEMKQAMIRYAPLRSAVTASQGKLSFSRLERLIAALNHR
jgi:beta-glucosidase